MIREYKTVEEISGPLMMVRMVENVTYDELVEIELHDGSLRRGKVLEVNGDAAVVQLFESAAGINLADAKVRFLGHPLQLGVSGDMLGRVFNGMGQPIDGGPAILADEYRDINGMAMNPAARKQARELEDLGFGGLPVCMAKTQYSFSSDPKAYGVAKDFELKVRDIIINNGAEMIVVVMGEIMRMPGLPKEPQARHIDIVNGLIEGLS